MSKIVAIELLNNVTLSEVMNSARGAELLEKHGRWSIMKTAGRVDRSKLGVFFFASRDDGQFIIAARTLMGIAEAIRDADRLNRHPDEQTVEERAKAVRRQPGPADPSAFIGTTRRSPEDDDD